MDAKRSNSVFSVVMPLVAVGLTHLVITVMPEQSRWLQMLAAVVVVTAATAILWWVVQRCCPS